MVVKSNQNNNITQIYFFVIENECGNTRKYPLGLQRRKHYPYCRRTRMAGPIDLIYAITVRYPESSKDLARCRK